MSLALLNERIGAINDLLTTVNLLVWDSRTMMPAGGAAARGRQIATLTRLARDLICDDEMLRRLEGAEREVAVAGADEMIAPRSARCARRSMRIGVSRPSWWSGAQGCRRPPRRPGSTRGHGVISPRSSRSWRTPWCWRGRRPMRSAGRIIPMMRWPDSMSRAKRWRACARLFGELRPELKRILAAAQARPAAARRAVRRLSGRRTRWRCPRASPRRSATISSAAASIRPSIRSRSRSRARMSASPRASSPTTSRSRCSARCTKRATASMSRMSTRPSRARSSRPTCSASMRSAAPAMGRMNRNRACSRITSAAALPSGAVTIPIWWRHFRPLRRCPLRRSSSPPSRRCRAGLIRTDADEVTYDFHVMMRVEIEAALLDGTLAARDLPARLARAHARQSRPRCAERREGCLQDAHWAAGLVGSFCTYTIGNIMAAQLFEAACGASSQIRAALEEGDVGPLSSWLREAVWRHGRRFHRNDLLTQATGSKLNLTPYLRHLSQRYLDPAHRHGLQL